MVTLALDNRELAEKYDELSDSQFENGKRLVEKLGITTGQTVLDIGCGTGRLGFHVLDLIGPRGKLIGIDPLPDRIALATEKKPFSQCPVSGRSGRRLEFRAR